MKRLLITAVMVLIAFSHSSTDDQADKSLRTFVVLDEQLYGPNIVERVSHGLLANYAETYCKHSDSVGIYYKIAPGPFSTGSLQGPNYPSDLAVVELSTSCFGDEWLLLSGCSNIPSVEQLQSIHAQGVRHIREDLVIDPEKVLKGIGDDNELYQLNTPRFVRWPTGRSLMAGAAKAAPVKVVEDLQCEQAAWANNILGQGVRVGIFDTGLSQGNRAFRHVRELVTWTEDGVTEDHIGHGSFVAGIVGSIMPSCPGIAPEVDLHIFRIFTDKQLSYTSWFLDAFNYTIHRGIHVVNLSIGGPDFLDRPFVEKVWEMSANGVVLVSAIGNDGPLYGTLNNPGDQMDVVGVGAADSRILGSQDVDWAKKDDGLRDPESITLAEFSSRGMTTWELPQGYGRVKPDLLSPGTSLLGLKSTGQHCRLLSGTSVASPVVAGAVALIMQVLHAQMQDRRFGFAAAPPNVATVKQILQLSARRLKAQVTNEEHGGTGIFDQGAGLLDLPKALSMAKDFRPRVTSFPPTLDFTDCPYMWPWCEQPMYRTHQPLVANLTILNSYTLSSTIAPWDIEANWVAAEPRGRNPAAVAGTGPVFVPGDRGDWLSVKFDYAEQFWPFSGWLAVTIEVVRDPPIRRTEKVTAEGTIRTQLVPSGITDVTQINRDDLRNHMQLEIPVKVMVSRTPPRRWRLLWDQYHSLQYPLGYFPRDNLRRLRDPLDWNGDHPHTNFRSFFKALRNKGFFLEVLNKPLTCFDARNYGALMLVDTEDDFHHSELKKIENDVKEEGLSLVVFAEWYDLQVMERITFFDENTRRWWSPDAAGGNIPALNDLLRPFGIGLSGRVYRGQLPAYADQVVNPPDAPSPDDASRSLPDKPMYASGTSIREFPRGGHLYVADFFDEAAEIVKDSAVITRRVPYLGLWEGYNFRGDEPGSENYVEPGRIAVYGDTNCLDDAYLVARQGTEGNALNGDLLEDGAPCLGLMMNVVSWSSTKEANPSLLAGGRRLAAPYQSQHPEPARTGFGYDGIPPRLSRAKLNPWPGAVCQTYGDSGDKFDNNLGPAADVNDPGTPLRPEHEAGEEDGAGDAGGDEVAWDEGPRGIAVGRLEEDEDPGTLAQQLRMRGGSNLMINQATANSTGESAWIRTMRVLLLMMAVLVALFFQRRRIMRLIKIPTDADSVFKDIGGYEDVTGKSHKPMLSGGRGIGNPRTHSRNLSNGRNGGSNGKFTISID